MNTKNQITVVESTVVLSDLEIVTGMKNANHSTSEMIRALGKIFVDKDNNPDRSRIVKAFISAGVTTKNGEPIRYQHVRNVLITPVKKQ